jgi:mannose-1-phosphate guanylyltransferase
LRHYGRWNRKQILAYEYAEISKQFQDILGVGRTMIQQTYDRISRIIPNENIFVITNKEYVELSHQQLPEVPQENIVGNLAENTAPCNLYMANKIAETDPDATMIVPADHLILKEETFLKK